MPPKKFKKRRFAKKTVDKKQDKQISKITKMLSAQDSIFYNDDNTFNTVTNNWAVVPVTLNIPQGDEIGNRAGGSIFCKYISFHLTFQLTNVHQAVASPSYRFVVFRSTSTGAYPNITDLFDEDTFYGLPSYESKENRTITKVKDVVVSPTGYIAPTVMQTWRRHHRFTVRVNKKVSWITNGVDAASVGKNQYWLGLCQDAEYSATTADVRIYQRNSIVFTP